MPNAGRAIVVAIGLVAGTTIGAGCNGTDCAANATCAGPGSGADAGADGGRVYPDAPPPPGCAADGDPKDSPACVDDAYSLFVDSVNGSDANPGTRASPLKSIGSATNIDRLAGRQRIYACGGGAYDEHIALPPNVSLVGGFSCGSWQFVAGQSTTLQSTSPGLVIRIGQSTRTVVLSDLAITAADGVPDAESSVAVFVNAATAIFWRVSIHAGAGKEPAAWAQLASNQSNDSAKGQLASSTTPGGATACTCAVQGRSMGGAGGAGGQKGTDGAATPTPPPGTPDGKGGEGSSASGCGPGQNGNAGGAGAGGVMPAAVGTLDPLLGWVGAPGGNGGVGGPGNGGGGGGGTSAMSGGGGGCGGCGGNGGRGGRPGGSSIALAQLDANLTVFGCSFVAAAAANGASGERGENGFAGGIGGTTTPSSSCNGGTGGPGAGGGGGAGGSGGVSAAVVRLRGTYVGDTATTTTLDNGGGGLAGRGGSGAIGPSGTGAEGTGGAPGQQLLGRDTMLVLGM